MSNKFYGLANEVHWNPLTGCDATAISPGCDNCWARAMAKRYGCKIGWPTPDSMFVPKFHPDRLDEPSLWRKPRIVPTCFMGDWMAEGVETEWIHRVLDIMSANPHHTFLTLTKRPNRLVSELCREPLIPNVWLGVSAENQEWYDKRCGFLHGPTLTKWHTWLSLEPLLSHVVLDPAAGQLDFVVVGCESGSRRRPCNGEWVRDVVRQAQALGIPCYVKQIRMESGYSDWPADLRVRQYPKEFVK